MSIFHHPVSYALSSFLCPFISSIFLPFYVHVSFTQPSLSPFLPFFLTCIYLSIFTFFPSILHSYLYPLFSNCHAIPNSSLSSSIYPPFTLPAFLYPFLPTCLSTLTLPPPSHQNVTPQNSTKARRRVSCCADRVYFPVFIQLVNPILLPETRASRLQRLRFVLFFPEAEAPKSRRSEMTKASQKAGP